MTDEDLQAAINDCCTLMKTFNVNSDERKRFWQHLQDLLQVQKIRALAKPSSLESEIASELGLKGACTCQ